ncbi:MAG: hypothetical protein KAW67_07215, partial [Candidatus Eisenbacteria sp.]|nr:hypothetical protein [Candidatus Eisenbacteria bacterium]
DARAGEPRRETGGSPLVPAVLHGSEDVASGGPSGGFAEMERQRERHHTPTPDDSTREERTSSGTGARTDGQGLELHDLSVWDSPDGSPYVYLSFAPISMEMLFEEVSFRRAVVEGEDVEVADVAPVLDEAHVGIELDGEPVVVSSLRWYYEAYGDLGGADVKYMPVCVIRVVRPELSAGEHGLSVRIEDVGTGAVGEGCATFECRPGTDQL